MLIAGCTSAEDTPRLARNRIYIYIYIVSEPVHCVFEAMLGNAWYDVAGLDFAGLG